jgi:hypothetical protein
MNRNLFYIAYYFVMSLLAILLIITLEVNNLGNGFLSFLIGFTSSIIYWVTRGYAVLDDASFPIVGEASTEPNDTFVSVQV